MAWGLPDPPSSNEPKANVYDSIPRVEELHLDGLVLLQIMKHCHENVPKCVTGSLLGLDNAPTLEVTYSFPSPDPENEDANSDQFQIDLMKNLREVNVDNNKIGWYQSAILGSFCSAAVIEYQFQYQDLLGPNSICLIYDPSQTTKGSLSIKAFRLSKAFFEQYKTGQWNREHFAKLDIRSSSILEEIPIRFHNTDLVSCWLYENVQHGITEQDFERLDMSTNTYLENNLNYLSAWVDELAQEHHKYQGYERALTKQRQQHQQWIQKRKEENKVRKERGLEPLSETDPNQFKPPPEPSRLESLLITKQINSYCEQINHFAGKGFERLFLAGSLHKD